MQWWYQYDKTGHGSVLVDIDEGHRPWHVTVASTDEKQSRRREDPAVDRTKRGKGYKQGHDPRGTADQPVPECLQNNEVES